MNQIMHFANIKNLQRARQSLLEKGIYLLEDAYDDHFRREAIAFMDGCKSNAEHHTASYKGVQEYYGGTELRIWDAQHKADLLNNFYQECNVTMSRLFNKDIEAFTLLAIKNNPLNEANDAHHSGRWHIDSFSRQLKIFLFLTDTHQGSGPFEFFPGTHVKSFKFKSLLTGNYFKPKDLFLGGQRAYQKLDDAWVNQLSSKGLSSVPLICKAGTIAIVDTSAIHRAMPCLKDSRYALTTYFR